MTALTYPASVGPIANHFGVVVHRVEYAVRSRAIKPMGKVGNANAYDEEAVRRIGAALRDAHAKKQVR